MQGYLLDVSHVRAHFDGKADFLETVRLKVRPDTQWRVCSVTLGEIEFGNRVTTSDDLMRREEYRAFVRDTFAYHALEVSVHTSIYYADILDAIWKAHPPKPKTETEAHLVSLGVDINDVWVAAVAIEHNLTLLTQDKMKCIREADARLRCECWIGEDAAAIV